MQVRVTFQEGVSEVGQTPRKTTVVFQAGHNLLEMAQARGVAINAPCGGRGSCGKCLIRVLSGPSTVSHPEAQMLSEGMLGEGLRLACQQTPRLPVLVEVQNRFDIHSAPAVRPTKHFDPEHKARHVLLAVDLGSTSVQMTVFDADRGLSVGELSLLNKQVRRGHDVMTRLTYAMKAPEARAELTEDGRETLRELWQAARSALTDADAEVLRWVVAGNSVMTHLLWGESIETLAEAPYRPAFMHARQAPADALGLPGRQLYSFPLLGSFVGGDTAAALLAERFDQSGPARMLVDIGTNTEVALQHGESILVCSTPAGPAFEGGNISVGMRAEVGAITSIEVREDGAIRAHTIGGGKAKGICGTGLLEVVRELVRSGLVSRDGTVTSGQSRIALSRGVELLQSDIRELQLAKGALRTATKLVLAQAGLRDRDLSEVLLAGAFGAHLSPKVAMELQMLPAVEPTAVRAIGNASLAGACQMALEPELSEARLKAIQQKLHHVELAMHDDFQRLFIESLNF